jgi:spermidine synthase
MRLFAPERRLFESRRGNSVVQVFEKGDRRELRFGNAIVQSAVALGAPDALLLEYTRAMLAGMLFFPQPEAVLHLGLGAGALPGFIHRHWPTVRQKTVEINPDVIESSYKYFDLPVSRRLAVTEADARDFLSECRDSFDLMFVDAFVAEGAAEGSEDPHFLAMQHHRLTPRGWAVHNAWGSDRERLGRLSARLAMLYPCMYAISVRSHSNVILICGSVPEPPPLALLSNRAASLARAVPFDFARWIPRLRPLGAAQRSRAEAWIARA